MDEILFADIPVEQRKQMLEDNCDKIIEHTFLQRYNQDELNERRREFTELHKKMSELNNELAAVKADYKGKIKPLSEQAGLCLQNIKQNGEYVTAPCYIIVDGKSRKTGIYSPQGLLLEERPATPEELSGTLFSSPLLKSKAV